MIVADPRITKPLVLPNCTVPWARGMVLMQYSDAVSWMLLVGAALNLAGAAKLLIFEGHATNGESVLFKWFTAGAATVFGCLYLFLYWHTPYVHPFLFFGAALKTWASVIALVLFVRREISGRRFVDFGITNGLVALGFWVYLATT